jgi:hypothetical protein
MTVTEIALIDILRDKIADNPLKTIDDDDGGTTTVADTDKQIWSDAELLRILNSSLTLMFKGRIAALDDLSDYDQLLVTIQANIELLYMLAQDSARYVKYTIRDVDVEKRTPGEFLDTADALEKRLEKLANESPSAETSGVSVIQSFSRRKGTDQLTQLDVMRPVKYQPPANFPSFKLSSAATGVEIKIGYAFIPDYSYHLLKRTDIGILEEYFALEELTYTDTNVTSNATYEYELEIFGINGNETSKKLSITYVTPT